MRQQPGYILFVTFSMLALATALVTLFVMQGMHHKRFAQALLYKQQAQQFAISSLALGQSFLTFTDKEMKEVQQEFLAEKIDGAKGADGQSGFSRLLLEKVLPVINKKQKLELTLQKDGVQASIEMMLFCENGKININSLYNIVDKKFYDEGFPKKDKKVFAAWLFDQIAKITGRPSLLNPFVQYMEKQKAPLNDVTQLLSIPEFAQCFQDAIFYEVDEQKEQDITKEEKAKIYLTDIFTAVSDEDTLQPWLLSPSVCVLLGEQEKEKKDTDGSDSKGDKAALAQFKNKANWAADWDTTLQKIYGISYAQIPNQIRLMLTPEFQVNIFSLLLQVKIGQTKAKIYAFLKQRILPNKDIFYDVIKVYQV